MTQKALHIHVVALRMAVVIRFNFHGVWTLAEHETMANITREAARQRLEDATISLVLQRYLIWVGGTNCVTPQSDHESQHIILALHLVAVL